MRRFCSVICLSFGLVALALPVAARAQVICVSNVSPPPELPVYEQPPIPASGYLWSPGYWASGPNGYFWVPGTWVQPPATGLLWTPGYWSWRDGLYVWNAGYWGPHVGFYGGVNYGFGYGGVGYEGGRWENGAFAYNRVVNNFCGIAIANVYEKAVIVDPGAPRVSFNGGSGGTTGRPTAEEEIAAREQHVAAIPAQLQHERTASADKALLASENHGRPAVAATAKPGEFTGKGVVAAREPSSMPLTKPIGAAVGPNPTGPKMLDKKEPPGKNEATINGEKPAKTETKPLATEGKPSNIEKKPPGNEAKLPNNEGKLLNTEAKPSNTEKKPPSNEAKLPNNEGKPLNTETKPSNTEKKPPRDEAKLPNNEGKPQSTTPPKGSASPPPQVANAPKPHPGPVDPHAKPKDAKDKKPPPQ